MVAEELGMGWIWRTEWLLLLAHWVGLETMRRRLNFKDDDASDEWRAIPDGNSYAGWMSRARGSIPMSQ